MQVKIEKGIPRPKEQWPRRSVKYPWAEMEVGDSFFVQGMTQRNICGAANSAKKKNSHKYTIRTVTEGGVKGVRVWRVE